MPRTGNVNEAVPTGCILCALRVAKRGLQNHDSEQVCRRYVPDALKASAGVTALAIASGLSRRYKNCPSEKYDFIAVQKELRREFIGVKGKFRHTEAV